VIGLFLGIELTLTFVVAAVAFIIPSLAVKWPPVERRFQWFVNRPRLTVVFIGLVGIAARLAILPLLPIPQPTLQDEFSYLLSADTFLHGRLANPAHPMWTHFESFHINQQPTYASMYYPGQGLLLAFGKAVFGHPFFGVCLSLGVMCAAIAWMLQGWLPAKWAGLGGLLAITRIAMFSYWANSYYGGSLPAIGGALVLGALPRIKQRQRVRDAMLMAVGLSIIANTRAFEGVFFGIAVAVALCTWMCGKNGPPFAIAFRRIVLPIALLLAFTITGMGYYFWRVTGSPFRIPYQINIDSYGLMYFPWQQPRPAPVYRHVEMRNFYRRYGIEQYLEARQHPFKKMAEAVGILWLFFLGPLLSLPFIIWFIVKPRSRFGRFISSKSRWLLFICFVSSLGLLLPIHVPQPHYAAPLTPAVYALLLQALRHSRLWRGHNQPSGAMIVLAIPIATLMLLALRLAAVDDPALLKSPNLELVRTWCSPRYINISRAELLTKLAATPDQYLVIVRYTPTHDLVFNEWVYNEADIDKARVVWAREMSNRENQALIDYFHDRKVLLVEADATPVKVSPYTIKPN